MHKLTDMKDSPPPGPNPLPAAVAPVPLAIAPTQVPIKANIGTAGTLAYQHPAVVAAPPVSSPSHFQMQHFQPRPVPQPIPQQAPVHLQPQPQPMPMHVPHSGMPQMQPSPHYPSQAYPPQYSVQPQMAPQPIPYQTAAHIAPSFDQLHRPVHHAPSPMTNSRQAMAPVPGIGNIPHAGAHPSHVYNVPRAPEVYTLPDNVDAAIPQDVRERFQRDEHGRVLFFTAPPINRPDSGVAEPHSGLGHSVHYLARIKKIREERDRKRKERDEAIAREQEANKRRSPSAEEAAQRQAEAEQKSEAEMLEKVLLGFAAEIDHGTKVLQEQIGGFDSWRAMMREAQEETKGLKDEEMRRQNLQWFYDDLLRRGEITEQQKQEYEDTFIHRKHLQQK
jgi:chromatin structure-remodeling complex subunit RSC1/2